MFKLFRPQFSKISLSISTLILIFAFYFATIMNYPVLSKIIELSATVSNPWFPYTAPFLLFFSFIIIFTLLSLPYFFKFSLAIITMTSAAALYAAVNFQVMFDSTMMENVFETNTAEAFFYISVSSIIYVVVFGLIPTIFLFYVKITPAKSYSKAIAIRIALIILGGIGLLFIASISYKDYASVGRNNRYLNKMIIPAHIYNSFRYVTATYLTPKLPYLSQGMDATVTANPNGKPTLLVFVLGETARAQNMAYNGYERDTNPYTKDMGLIAFQDVSSCGTYTALSVPCMFSNLTRDTYNKNQANSQDNVLDVISHAGVDILWIDNDGGDKGVASKRLPYVTTNPKLENENCNNLTCFDAILLKEIEEFVAPIYDNNVSNSHVDRKDKLLVLHTIGSHGPTYWQRYPESMAPFTPACNRNDIENCSDKEIVNTYDNTLVYTDYILSKVINDLNKRSEQYNVAMMYVSDHGESLGENGLYLHGTPYAIAPDEQTKIPWFIWLPKQYAQQKSINKKCLEDVAQNQAISHDNLFHSLLGFYGINTQLKDNNLDITQACKANKEEI